MENCSAWYPNLLITELTQGQELARQLEALLDRQTPPEQCRSLLQSIQSTLDKAISMAKSSSGDSAAGTDSPRSVSRSPRSESPDRAVLKDRERREMCKKRKTLPKWTSQVSVCSGTGSLEGPPDDGFSWRKYGQKDILGARFPRGYYRCTHRNAQGCPATKQVQRSDENPSIFDVTYRGNHTCVQRGTSSFLAPATATAAAKQEPPQNPFLLNFRTSLTVKTEGLDHLELSSPFSFASTTAASCGNATDRIFSSPSTPLDNNHFVGNLSPAFISPADSGTGHLPVSPLGGGENFLALESDLTEIVSAAASAASAASSLTVDLDFMLGTEFDPNFPFDASFFS